MDDEILKKYGYVMASDYRTRVLKSLGGGVRMHREISQISGINRKYISKVLRDLKEHDLAECINEEMRKGRLYRLTEDGKKVLEYFNETHGQ